MCSSLTNINIPNSVTNIGDMALVTVIAFPHVSNLKSFNVLAKKSLNHYNYIIQAQETLDIAKEIDFRDRYGSLWTNGWMCHSLDCIKFHKRHAFEKLGVANITEAISICPHCTKYSLP